MITDKSIALVVASDIAEKTKNGGDYRIGLDTEFDSNGVSVIALDFEGDPPAVLIHPYDWKDKFEKNMKSILELECVVIVGVNVATDLHKLRTRFGIKFKRLRELRRYCLNDIPSQKTSLQAMAATYLGLHVDKSHQRSNFNVKPPLAVPLQKYAVGDAILPLEIDDAITSRLVDGGISSARYPPDLQPGVEIIIKIGGVEAAIAELEFLGEHGNNSGQSTMWGNLYIGARKALVRLVAVHAHGAKVPHQHIDWGPERLTLGEVFDRPGDCIIAINASQIHRKISGNQPTIDRAVQHGLDSTASLGNRNATNVAALDDSTATTATVLGKDDAVAASGDRGQAGDGNDGDSNVTTSRLVGATEAVSSPINNDDDDVDDIRSREKSDIWHEHYNVPLTKDSPASPMIHDLLRGATMAINEVEQRKVQAVLASRGITNFNEHFFFNKEYWYRRVRMPPRKCEEASTNLLNVLNYIQTNDALKEYATDDFVKHVTGWARRCLEGRYEDLDDVEMYTHIGYDSDGLDLWIRRRGSKAENFHQKMIVAAGPFGFGIETSHYLQVILAYMYTINAGINRCGEPDFGHFMLHLEDRIQTRMQQIWGVDLFTNRINISEHKPLDFVAVGVGPLSHDEKYVTKGQPADSLENDLKFMAERMRVKYPPLPPSSEKEFGMIKRFCSENPQPKEADIQRLCRIFKSQSDGVDVFPKLPSMIRPSVKRWKINQQQVLLRLQTRDSYNELFDKLKRQTVTLPPPQNPKKTIHTKQTTRNDEASVHNSTDRDKSAPPQLPCPHVAPLCAPTQERVIPVFKATFRRCAFWPICEMDCKECGGDRKELCKTYGTNRTKKAPSQQQLDLQIRLNTWGDLMKARDCAWHPFCKKKAVVCGGRIKNECSDLGVDGCHIDERPTDEELKIEKRRVSSEKRCQRRNAAN